MRLELRPNPHLVPQSRQLDLWYADAFPTNVSYSPVEKVRNIESLDFQNQCCQLLCRKKFCEINTFLVKYFTPCDWCETVWRKNWVGSEFFVFPHCNTDIFQILHFLREIARPPLSKMLRSKLPKDCLKTSNYNLATLSVCCPSISQEPLNQSWWNFAWHFSVT